MADAFVWETLTELQKQKYELKLAIQKGKVQLTSAGQECKHVLDERELKLEQTLLTLPFKLA